MDFQSYSLSIKFLSRLKLCRPQFRLVDANIVSIYCMCLHVCVCVHHACVCVISSGMLRLASELWNSSESREIPACHTVVFTLQSQVVWAKSIQGAPRWRWDPYAAEKVLDLTQRCVSQAKALRLPLSVPHLAD